MALPIWGNFMNSALKEKEFSHWDESQFSMLPDSILHMMDCDHYQEEMPIFVDNPAEEELNDFEKALDEFFDNIFKDIRTDRNPTRVVRITTYLRDTIREYLFGQKIDKASNFMFHTAT